MAHGSSWSIFTHSLKYIDSFIYLQIFVEFLVRVLYSAGYIQGWIYKGAWEEDEQWKSVISIIGGKVLQPGVHRCYSWGIRKRLIKTGDTFLGFLFGRSESGGQGWGNFWQGEYHMPRNRCMREIFEKKKIIQNRWCQGEWLQRKEEKRIA